MSHKSGMRSKHFKFSKKHLDRQFSLGMILLYCIKHTNHHTVAPIIAMLNWFLRNLGDSTQEERESIDHVEYKLLNNEVDDIQIFEDLIDDNLSEQTGDDQGKCFKFVNDYIKEKVAAAVNKFYQGSAANLTLLEIVFFDHNLLKKRNAHTALLKCLCAWGTIEQLSPDEMKKHMTAMANKMHTLPDEGYKEWNLSDYVNDKKTCMDIGDELGEKIKYSRKKEEKSI